MIVSPFCELVFLSKPAAFRPLLTESLALSGKSLPPRNTNLLSSAGDYVNKENELGKTYLFLCQLESNSVNLG
jgi:hypothetical protein